MAALRILVLVLALAATASACIFGSCSKDFCDSLSALDGLDTYAKGYTKRNSLGELIGAVFNTNSGINLEYFDSVRVKNVIEGNSATSLAGCCNACRLNAHCVYYHYFLSTSDASTLSGYGDLPAAKQTRCLLLGKKATDKTGTAAPNAPVHSVQKNYVNDNKHKLSYVGGACGGQIVNDPHLVGGHGTPFDFNGKLDKSFCLTTDKNLQINVVLRGYEDARTNGATVQANGKALRSWIKEVGFLWVSPVDGSKHSLHMVARDGKQQERGDGFLSKVTVDGQAAALPSLGGSIRGDGGLALTLAAVEKTGPFDVDMFTLRIDGVADVELRMRVAHPALQAPEDAEAHFNLYLTDIRATDSIHGVLGQTFRESTERVERAVKYSEMASLLKAPVAADGASGKGFLDGAVEDYVTPDVLSPGCKFSTFSA